MNRIKKPDFDKITYIFAVLIIISGLCFASVEMILLFLTPEYKTIILISFSFSIFMIFYGYISILQIKKKKTA
jgi:hypothetical protein